MLDRSVQFVKGVGPTFAEILSKLGIRTVADLLLHLPRSYDDLTDVRSLDDLTPDTLQTVQGEVVEIEGKDLPDGRRIVSVVLADDRGRVVEGVWFNQVGVARFFRYGSRVSFSGKPRWYRDHWQMNHPRFEILGEEGPNLSVLPVYPLTEDLRPDRLREWIRTALAAAAAQVEECLPEEIRTRRGYSSIERSLWEVHFPETLAQGRHARSRFIYEELLQLQTGLALRRRELREQEQAPRLPTTQAIDEHIRKLFPFAFTPDQDRAVAALRRDLAGDRPMQRLLQADVGAGKTAVAVYGLLVAVANKHQAALMAPTEVLARQHWNTLENYLAASRVRRLLLTGGATPVQRRDALQRIAAGEIDLVVGTQALVQEDVRFANLGLVVIDEQHKFGVHQRAKIRKLGVSPHYLVMTATPIPRTVALTVFGDLDVSIMRGLPPGRQPVRTRWVPDKQREKTWDRLKDTIQAGHQAYVVCPLVEESESLDVKAAQTLFEELTGGPFADVRVGLLHGRLSPADKLAVMDQFRAGELDLLVTTVVIEVGVDVPNATVMVIEHADRFGLSQLHQLRGRVSRGRVAGECLLFAPGASDEARHRLETFCRLTDGFALAEEDARQRGLGEFFGTRQHGLGEFRFADPLIHRELLEMAREDALRLVAADPGLQQPENAALRRAVLTRYGKTLDLAEIG